MIPFERRQRLLRFLRDEPGIRVPALARALHVTEATVRSDLGVLEGEQKVRRVRGGAVLLDGALPAEDALPVFSTPLDHADPKGLGRWAAELVEDGDTILLDDSPLVLGMVPHLAERRRLTVATNGFEAARRLATDASNAVILVGGFVRQDGRATGGIVGAQLLADLHFDTAFVSGDGFDFEEGLMDGDLQAAQLKRSMLDAASHIVALVDAERLGRKGLSAIASPARITHLFTDNGALPQQVDRLRRLTPTLTICGENTVTRYTPHRATPTIKIGFANLSEEIPFAVDVRRSIERAAKQLSNIDLVVADNRLSGERALGIADNFIAKHVDLAVEYQIDASMGALIMAKYQTAGIPVIAVDIPMVGATYFGVNNYHSGHLAGLALGRWIRKQWEGALELLVILEEPRAGALPQARIHGQIQGLAEELGSTHSGKRVTLNSGNTSVASEAAMLECLENHPAAQRIAVVSFNDDAALGALHAAQRCGREEHVAIVGQGADRLVREELRRADSRIIGSTAFLPDRYGDRLMELAERILRGESVPPAVYMDHVFIDADNVDNHDPADVAPFVM